MRRVNYEENPTKFGLQIFLISQCLLYLVNLTTLSEK